MASSLPLFRPFDMNTEPASQGLKWKSWISDFDNLMLAINIDNKKRMKALLLFYAGPDVHALYKTLSTDAAEEYDAAAAKLNSYFEPKVNKTYEIYHFRRLFQNEPSINKGGETESIDEFVTRLRKSACRCGFTDATLEIKLQVVFGCLSKKVRRKALSDEISLDDLLKFARSEEMCRKQASVGRSNY